MVIAYEFFVFIILDKVLIINVFLWGSNRDNLLFFMGGDFYFILYVDSIKLFGIIYGGL